MSVAPEAKTPSLTITWRPKDWPLGKNLRAELAVGAATEKTSVNHESVERARTLYTASLYISLYLWYSEWG
jgi:hypothetical protein